MVEAAIVLGVVLGLIVVGTLVSSVAWTTIVVVGVSLMGLGFVLGVPAGLYYHVVLYRMLKPRGVLPRRWYWSPVGFHGHLLERERRSVMRWFYLGGSGFLLIMLGGAIAGLGLAIAS
jgi:hypothetical protein